MPSAFRSAGNTSARASGARRYLIGRKTSGLMTPTGGRPADCLPQNTSRNRRMLSSSWAAVFIQPPCTSLVHPPINAEISLGQGLHEEVERPAGLARNDADRVDRDPPDSIEPGHRREDGVGARDLAGVRLAVGEEIDRLGVEAKRRLQGVGGRRAAPGTQQIDESLAACFVWGVARVSVFRQTTTRLLKATMLSEVASGNLSIVCVSSRWAASSRGPRMLPEMSITKTIRLAWIDSP